VPAEVPCRALTAARASNLGLQVAQDRDREQSRRPHRAIGLLELAGEARGGDDIAGAADAAAAAFAMRDQRRIAPPRGDRRGGMAHMDHQRAAAARGAVDPFRREAQVIRNRHRRLAGGRDPVDTRQEHKPMNSSEKVIKSRIALVLI
jgi:hypothetical protein